MENNEELKNKTREFAKDVADVYMVSFGITWFTALGYLFKQGINGHSVFHDFNWANISPNANLALITNTEVGDVISTFLVLLIPAVLGAVLLGAYRASVASPNKENQQPEEIEMSPVAGDSSYSINN
jgi:hypothetical protein